MRFSGTDAYGLQVIFVSDSIPTIGKAHCCRRALDELRKRLSSLQRVQGVDNAVTGEVSLSTHVSGDATY